MSSIRQFRTALAAARLGSFAEAGRQIGLTQAAVSLQIKNLENELEIRMFERGAHSLTVTPDGRQVLARLNAIVSDYDSLRIRADGVLRGTLHIGALVSALMGSFGSALAHIKRDYPALDVRLFAGQSAQFARMVSEGELDAAVVTEPPGFVPDGLMWTPFYQEPLVLIAPLASGRKPVLELLRTEPFLQFDRSLWTGRLVNYALDMLEVAPTIAMELNSIEAIAQLVRQHYGVAIVPHLANAEWSEQQLIVKPLPGRPIMRAVGMLERLQHSKKPITQALCALFDEQNHTRYHAESPL
ncbi:LysR family transcriptional regulator [Allopusillimonas ginsengisoli]|uniref:LysR family transcriptional regulator n=1 Tax=Allopusillimonas ginsengisoli TaxID=453575 RepID=UPI001021CE2E|nr:LysR family transcriptional regulator [Allopusillimonas ginsengisoli]TEA77898.1 LysR family transcriptional regulator [Allopusillimonas ginsengisoli]